MNSTVCEVLNEGYLKKKIQNKKINNVMQSLLS